MTTDPGIRRTLSRALAWSDAHVALEDAVRGLPEQLRGARPEGLPHSPWQILEHIRISQRDILDFCSAGEYHGHEWPDDYWPDSPAPPDAGAWDASVAAIREDQQALRRILDDDGSDLMVVVSHGTDQTLLREVLLVLDHNAYHMGQLVTVRQLLGAWPPASP
jgi:uncharacterized damage-inducible protein DinB